MKTIAAVLVKQRSPLELWELEIPDLLPGQALVKMAYSGLCHSQLNEINGTKGEDPYLPHTLGHEGSGTVIAVSAEVSKVKAGDKVVLSWIKGMGADIFGTKYASVFGTVNSGAISTFMQYAVVSENRLIPIAHEMPLKEAALLGCAIPTGAGVVKNEMKIQEGNSFAVFGAGGVGLSALLAAKFSKASPIIAVDIHPEKLARAKSLGADIAINSAIEDPVAVILKETKGSGIDYVFESAGKKVAMEQAFRSLKAPNGLCVLAGNLPKGEQIAIDPFELIRGKRIIGTWGGKSEIDKDVAYYTSLYLNNGMNFDGLITHLQPLSQINELVNELSAGKVGRGLIDLTL